MVVLDRALEVRIPDDDVGDCTCCYRTSSRQMGDIIERFLPTLSDTIANKMGDIMRNLPTLLDNIGMSASMVSKNSGRKP